MYQDKKAVTRLGDATSHGGRIITASSACPVNESHLLRRMKSGNFSRCQSISIYIKCCLRFFF